MMNVDMEQHLESLDRRLARVEQILPGLATKEDLAALRVGGREDVLALRSRTEVLIESVRDDIRLVAEGVAALTEQLQRKRLL